MQLTEAMQRSGPVLNAGLSVVHTVLPSPAIREIMTDKILPAKVSHEDTRIPCTASRQDSIPISPVPLPGMPGTGRPAGEPSPATKSPPASLPKIARSRSASASRRISKTRPFTEQDIPLYLVPHIIARAIWQRGELTFRISVIRTKQHYYTIRLRTARVPASKGTRPGAKSRSDKNKQGCPGKT